MSAVVLRCPTCGTTQSHPGECEACFEGVVRYFCDNHTPGLWLDAPACHECGARFGEAPPKPAKRPPIGAPEEPGPEPRHRTSRSSLPRRGEPAVPRRRRPPTRVPGPEDAPAAPSLADLLAEVTKRERHEERHVPWAEPAAPAPRVSIPVVGCLVRLVLLVLFLIALALAAVAVLLSGSVP